MHIKRLIPLICITHSLLSAPVEWEFVSTSNGTLPAVRLSGKYYVSTLVFDADNDGLTDFVIGSYGGMALYVNKGGVRFETHIIENGLGSGSEIEAGGAFADIDGDGDIDIVQGGHKSQSVWWWENPNPDFGSPWRKRTIVNSGGDQCHDQVFGDFDGDGILELAYFKNGSGTIYLAEIPSGVKKINAWPVREVGAIGGKKPEGLDTFDMDGDGVTDIVGAGHWFKHRGGSFSKHAVDAGYVSVRMAAGQLIQGGTPEIVQASGDARDKPLVVYTAANAEGTWHTTTLISAQRAGHSLELADFDNDGNLDIMSGEALGTTIWVIFGDGRNAENFRVTTLSPGVGMHEGKTGDIDGDGDIDIIGKTLSNEGGEIYLWLNNGTSSTDVSRHTRRYVPVPANSRPTDRRGDRGIYVLPGRSDKARFFETVTGLQQEECELFTILGRMIVVTNRRSNRGDYMSTQPYVAKELTFSADLTEKETSD